MNVSTIETVSRFSPLLKSKAISVALSHCPPEEGAVKKALGEGGMDASTAGSVAKSLAQAGYIGRNLDAKC